MNLEQNEIFGFDSIQNLGDIIKKFNAKKVFLVTGRKSYSISGSEEKISPLLNDVEYVFFNDFKVNPDLDDLKRGLKEFERVKPDFVVAVGGGSVIDIAKAINVLAANPGDPKEYIFGKKTTNNPGKPFVAIPLTAGTGTEVTRYATIYVDKAKYSLTHDSFTIPTVAIIDPILTKSMPPYLTASTGLDALCQGVESYWASRSTDESRKHAEKAINLAWTNLEKAVKNPDDESRKNMAKAAYISGKAINISRTTACHSISYPFTSYFNIPHGHAVALTLPEIIEFNYNLDETDCNDDRGPDFVKKRLREIIKILQAKDEIDAKEKIKDFMSKINVETKLRKLNIDEKGVELIISKGFTANRMNNNPRKIEKEQLKEILERIL